jgi:hypothetical protein
MANLDWLTETVNTKGRPCPMMKKKCPGSRERCAFWLEFSVQNASGESTIRRGCLFAWQYVMANEVVVETVRTQATVDKAATELRGASVAARGFFEAAAAIAQRRDAALTS